MYMKRLNTALLVILFTLFCTQTAFAQTFQQIDKNVDVAIEKFKHDVVGGESFLAQAKGYLVFPTVLRAGLIVGGKYGEGALRINNKTAYYYEMTAASIGLQAGAQKYSMLIAFLSETALHNFIQSNGWESGVDGTITVADWGASKDISSISYEKPIIAFIYGEKGLMASVSIAGTKFRKITP